MFAERRLTPISFWLEELASVFYFPVWWYTKGLIGLLNWCRQGMQYRLAQYSFVLWIRNFFVPMYGEYNWSGRLMSVFMRAVVIVGRGIALLVEALAYFIIILVWVLLLPFLLVKLIALPFVGFVV